MKNLLMPVLVAVLLCSCSGNKSDEHSHDGSHPQEHGEGSHNHDQPVAGSAQEEFTVGADSAASDSTHPPDHPHGSAAEGHQH